MAEPMSEGQILATIWNFCRLSTRLAAKVRAAHQRYDPLFHQNMFVSIAPEQLQLDKGIITFRFEDNDIMLHASYSISSLLSPRFNALVKRQMAKAAEPEKIATNPTSITKVPVKAIVLRSKSE